MALIPETGAGVTGANSLASFADAETFHRGNNTLSRWEAATMEALEAGLRQATRYVCISWVYHGVKTNTDQPLCFPRKGLFDEDDNSVADDIVPQRVIDAVALLALYALDGALIDPSPGIRSRSAGGASQTFAGAHNQRNLGEARLLLRPFIARTLVGPSVQLSRVN